MKTILHGSHHKLNTALCPVTILHHPPVATQAEFDVPQTILRVAP